MTTITLKAANQNLDAFGKTLAALGFYNDIDDLFPELPFTPAEQALRMAALKARYEEKFPSSKAGKAQGLGAKLAHGKDTSGQQPAPAFTTVVVEHAAGRRGWGKSTIKHVIQRGERIKREVLDAIIADGEGNDPDLLDSLLRVGEEYQMAYYRAWKSGEPPPKATASPPTRRQPVDGWWRADPRFVDAGKRFFVPGYVDLRCADSKNELDTFEPESFDAIISDQPYGVGYADTKGVTVKDDEDPEPIASWSVPAMERMLKPHSFMVLHGVFKLLKDNREVMEVWRRHLHGANVPMRDLAIWDKVTPSALGGYLRHQHELVWICTKGNPRKQVWTDHWGFAATADANGEKEVGKRVAMDVDLWSIERPVGGEALHTTPKPVELHMRQMLSFSPPGGRLLDPFMGTGATAVAALRTGRSYVGIEAKSKWFLEAVRRVEVALAALPAELRPLQRPLALVA